MAIYDGFLGLSVQADPNSRLCNCVGPQRGEPVCPCRMPRLKIENGRYIEVIDHGPVKS
jgi:hypothetical protein